MQLAAVAVIVAAAVVVLVVTVGGSDAPPKPGTRQASRTTRAITALLAGIPQNGNALGRPTAPVTLEWYGDLECPFCKEFTLGALPTLIARWVRGGQLRIEYLSMESATREPKVFEAQQVAALSAGLQNKTWNYIETFYHEQGREESGYVTEAYLRGLASQVPRLDLALWNEDRADPVLAAQVIAERQAAQRARFHGTPTFLFGLTGGRMHKIAPRSLTSPRQYDEIVEYLLRADEE